MHKPCRNFTYLHTTLFFFCTQNNCFDTRINYTRQLVGHPIFSIFFLPGHTRFNYVYRVVENLSQIYYQYEIILLLLHFNFKRIFHENKNVSSTRRKNMKSHCEENNKHPKIIPSLQYKKIQKTQKKQKSFFLTTRFFFRKFPQTEVFMTHFQLP